VAVEKKVNAIVFLKFITIDAKKIKFTLTTTKFAGALLNKFLF
jgi:hypothetical protein